MLRQHQIDWDGRFPECSDESFGWSLLDTYVNELSHSIGCPGYLQPFTYPHQNEASMNPHGVGYFTTHANLSVFFQISKLVLFCFWWKMELSILPPIKKKTREGIHFSCDPQNVNVYSSPVIFSLYTWAYISNFFRSRHVCCLWASFVYQCPARGFFYHKAPWKNICFPPGDLLSLLS